LRREGDFEAVLDHESSFVPTPARLARKYVDGTHAVVKRAPVVRALRGAIPDTARLRQLDVTLLDD